MWLIMNIKKTVNDVVIFFIIFYFVFFSTKPDPYKLLEDINRWEYE